MPKPADSSPLGIKIICVLAAIGAIFALFVGLGLMAMAGGSGAPGWLALLGVLVIGLALLNFPMIYGLWTVKPWGWTLAMVLYGLNVVSQGISLLLGDLSAIVGLGIALAILLYIGGKAEVYGKSPLW